MDEERLIVALEARVTDFEKKMAQAERRASRSYAQMRRDSASATRGMEADMTRATSGINRALAAGGARMGAVGKAWAAGFVGGIVGGIAAAGVSGIVAQVNRVAESVAQVGDEAKRAGVSARVFQEWKFVAEQNRIGVDSLVDGLKELNLRADEFATTGKGSAAESFARLGYSAEEVAEKLKDPSALMLEIIGRMEQMDAAAQIRIADELFGGTAGERFVELLDQGEAGIRATIDRAHELGVVMDDELIAKADEINRRFNEMANTVGVALKSAIVSAADSLVDFINSFRDFENQRTAALESHVNGIIRQRAGLAEEQNALKGDAGLSDNARKLGFGARESAVTQKRIDDLQGRIDALSREEDEIIAILRDRSEFKPAAKPADRTWTPPAYTPPVEDGGKGGGASAGRAARERADEFQREAEALARRTAALKAGTLAQAEINPLLADFGHAAEFAAARTDLLLAAQQAGIPITAELLAQIEGLALGYADASAAASQLDVAQRDAVEAAADVARLQRNVIGGFAKDLLGGVDAAEAFARALGKVGDRLLDLALDSVFRAAPGGAGGGFGSIFSGLLGAIPGFANGGTSSGGLAWVGERGRELVNLPAGARVIPHGESEELASRAGRASAPQPVNVRVVNSIDPVAVLEAALGTREGERVLTNYIGRNRRGLKGVLG